MAEMQIRIDKGLRGRKLIMFAVVVEEARDEDLFKFVAMLCKLDILHAGRTYLVSNSTMKFKSRQVKNTTRSHTRTGPRSYRPQFAQGW